MPDFSKRSYEKELLDDPAAPFEDIRRNMQELNTINTWLGGHRITVNGVQQLAAGRKEISVCEIGCGGGDNLFVIYKWCKKNNIAVSLTGIDINSNCIESAHEQYKHLGIEFLCYDYKDVNFERKPDIIFNALFCHHFTDNEVVAILEWMQKNTTAGFFISDLHRHPLAYNSIKWITKLFSKSYLVKNDAPVSVCRGFTKKEWKPLLQKADINNAKISWQWAFRHLIVYRHEQQ